MKISEAVDYADALSALEQGEDACVVEWTAGVYDEDEAPQTWCHVICSTVQVARAILEQVEDLREIHPFQSHPCLYGTLTAKEILSQCQAFQPA